MTGQVTEALELGLLPPVLGQSCALPPTLYPAQGIFGPGVSSQEFGDLLAEPRPIVVALSPAHGLG